MKEESLPTVAVLMTLYQRDRLEFFSEALASIFRQNYPQERIRIYLAVDGPVPQAGTLIVKPSRQCGKVDAREPAHDVTVQTRQVRPQDGSRPSPLARRACSPFTDDCLLPCPRMKTSAKSLPGSARIWSWVLCRV